LFNLLNFYGTLLFGLNELLFGLFCEKWEWYMFGWWEILEYKKLLFWLENEMV
jgi:hypothetical protein